ncbi:MCP four helix bundle domain-containing protein [Pedobacter montanisoli]|uniref:MCP four helix bundle domain-containing protein n=1 Tax=Pedobacter montanisoli TaxID=2923277 RepID=A0ABS9ZT15_9SPHI|nr:MCP four helix bundle domain-containing protein [Pedobacter montanisoli]MCJ0741740.1 MCP four helix bundle domain-containing protein [Pedobacter montanisoli]
MAYTLKQKTKIALLLFAIMACMLLIRVLEDRSMIKMEKAFSSLYKDRLIPATDLFFISEKLYTKKYYLEDYVYRSEKSLPLQQLKLKFNDLNQGIDSLIGSYEKTFLINKEKVSLAHLKVKLAENRKLEENLMGTSHSDESQIRELYHSINEKSFRNITALLKELTQVQSSIGKEISRETEKIIKGTKLYSNAQLVLAIIIGILIVGIIFTSNAIKVKNDHFRLN